MEDGSILPYLAFENYEQTVAVLEDCFFKTLLLFIFFLIFFLLLARCFSCILPSCVHLMFFLINCFYLLKSGKTNIAA
jgi:hypothetical protein